jgi:glyoxylase-like metal-dependent hydrolase (beta-lactamase superfamily II)
VTARGVHALRYAYRTESVKGEHFYGHPEDCTAPWPIHYFTWVVVDEDAVTVVDAGFTREEAQRRGARTYLGSPVELLGELGVDPADVDHLVLTHLHYDHTGHLGDYPNARLWVQRRELDFWNGPFAHRGANAHLRPHEDLERLGALVDAGRVTLLDGDAAITGRVGVHLVGGHTAGMQVVRVDGPDGVVVLASDASHFYANHEQDRPYAIAHDVPAMHAAFDRLSELAGADGVVVPGHDPLVGERHEPVPGSGDRIIRLRPRERQEGRA